MTVCVNRCLMHRIWNDSGQTSIQSCDFHWFKTQSLISNLSTDFFFLKFTSQLIRHQNFYFANSSPRGAVGGRSVSRARSMKHCHSRLSIRPQLPPHYKCTQNQRAIHRSVAFCRPNLLAKHTRTPVQTLIDLVPRRSFQPGRSGRLTGIKKRRYPRFKTSTSHPSFQ